MKGAGWHVGTGQRQNPFLQIPLHEDFHVGNYGVDVGVGILTWERLFGLQMAMLERANDELGYPVHIFALAGAWQIANRGKVLLHHEA